MDPFIRIVLVEDEAITALDVAQQLRCLGYQVVAWAKTGPQAIEQALTHHPDVVLMDIHLQGVMDGVDAARHIQASAPIPVVYVSANVDAATLERIQYPEQSSSGPPLLQCGMKPARRRLVGSMTGALDCAISPPFGPLRQGDSRGADRRLRTTAAAVCGPHTVAL